MLDMVAVYESLDCESQAEVEALVSKLVLKKKQAVQKEKSHSENLALVESFLGQTNVWDGIDILEYQQQLRGEYRNFE